MVLKKNKKFSKFLLFPIDLFFIMMYINQRRRNVAQLVARLVWDQNVAGSSPVVPTPGRLAQLGEHLVYTQVVGGSIPSSPIKALQTFEVLLFTAA